MSSGTNSVVAELRNPSDLHAARSVLHQLEKTGQVSAAEIKTADQALKQAELERLQQEYFQIRIRFEQCLAEATKSRLENYTGTPQVSEPSSKGPKLSTVRSHNSPRGMRINCNNVSNRRTPFPNGGKPGDMSTPSPSHAPRPLPKEDPAANPADPNVTTPPTVEPPKASPDTAPAPEANPEPTTEPQTDPNEAP